MPKGNGPAKKFRIGFVTATVWKNDDFYNVNVSRSYKNDAGEWQDGDSLGHGDLLNASHVLLKACAWIDDQ
ncbi:MAG: hypothetical protein ABJP87_04470 [Bauldia litoralis]|uniref:hypothetical protein n=1 Tax=Bauldia litoralis TaxID=665467 RepID=UPI003296914B